jgi:GTP-binding protein LepA
MDNIRNFVIIAHIDSGKSTLADRLLEITGTVEARSMRPQYLDKLDLERERGITIKMAPVRMHYSLGSARYILNLIDTPGHSDFSYEVSRALNAVEGAVLLVDGTKGIQAQTLSNLRAARKAGLKIIGAVNKIDLDLPQLPKVIRATAELLGVPEAEIFRISAKTGQGAKELLDAVIERVPPPKTPETKHRSARALIFDSLYDDHKGILAFMRVFGGEFKAGDEIVLLATGAKFRVKESGYFTPEFKPTEKIREGEIGYIATGLKEPALIKIGDTIAKDSGAEALHGYREAAPVVFISFYPDGATKFEDLKKGLERLRLTDAALSFEPDANEALGRGLKVGFLGQLHFEITASRLKDEFRLEFLTSFPSIAYRVENKGVVQVIKQPQDFPDKPDKVWQPMIKVEILTPQAYLNSVVNLKNTFDLDIKEIENLGENLLISGRMPLSELIRDFDDRMKSVSAGYASFIYELDGEELADVEKLEILIVGDVVAALTRIVAKKDMEREGRSTVERLKGLLPQEQFSQALQARVAGRIIARETIPAMKKALGDFGKNGGDRTRKMKLWKKQQRGKERLQSMARVEISPEVFREILKK